MTVLLYIIAAIIDGFNSPILAIGLLCAGIGLIFLTSKRHVAALLLSGFLALGASITLKLLYAVPRPDLVLVEVTGYRFPSQHAILTSAFFSSLCFSAFCAFRSLFAKILISAFSLGAIIVVAWSRVFLQVHLPIDVIVGSVLGVSISFVVHYLILRKCYV